MSSTVPQVREHERVALTKDHAESALRAGDVGTVVHVYPEQAAYEVEFVAFSGESLGTFTIEAHGVRPLGEDDLPSSRSLSESA